MIMNLRYWILIFALMHFTYAGQSHSKRGGHSRHGRSKHGHRITTVQHTNANEQHGANDGINNQPANINDEQSANVNSNSAADNNDDINDNNNDDNNDDSIIDNMIEAQLCEEPDFIKSITIACDYTDPNLRPNIRNVFQRLSIPATIDTNGEPNGPFDYIATNIMGVGTNSLVIAAIDQETNEMMALKLYYSLNLVNGVEPEFEFMHILKALTSYVNIAAPLNSYTFLGYRVLEFPFFQRCVYHQYVNCIYKWEKWEMEALQKLSKQMLLVMVQLHRRDIVHLDIKPENIFVASNGDFYLGDFGLSLKLPATDTQYRYTKEYMAPEYINHRTLTTANDIWALGVTLLTLITPSFRRYLREVLDMQKSILRYRFPMSEALIEFSQRYFHEDLPSLKMHMARDPALSDALDVMDKAHSFDLQRYILLKDFIKKCLDLDPSQRITAKNALKHPFILDYDINVE